METALLTIDAERPALGLNIPKSASFDHWLGIGRHLCASSQVINWYIGDWWAAGQHRYGARAQAAAEGLFGRQFQTLANAASVCRAFETSRRREGVSWSHHAEVAALPPADADALLDAAEREAWSKQDLRRAVMRSRPASLRIVDRIDVYRDHPACVDFLSPDEVIVELATALGGVRKLTDRESYFLEKSVRLIAAAADTRQTEPWNGEQDFAVISMLGDGAKGKEIAGHLERSEEAIWSRIRYLRRKGLLEQPRITMQAAE